MCVWLFQCSKADQRKEDCFVVYGCKQKVITISSPKPVAVGMAVLRLSSCSYFFR